MNSREKSIIRYAANLTVSPSKIDQADIEKLRAVGFGEDDILNINMIAGYFNFVNRLTLGLGVEYSPEEKRGYNI